MLESEVASLLRSTMLVTIKVGGPALCATLVVGVLVSLVQAVTQISESTLAFVPKVVALGVALSVTGHFMIASLTDFTHRLFDRLVALGAS
ncbi:MAG: flagellar type III secretion system protein FliQ [Acetobacteraceae bacterium]|nr:flagellar type III secretion system protein FliQ [Acetobacteraceae bacterium]